MSRPRFLVIGSMVLLVVTGSAYLGALWNDFVEFDDNIYVIYNSHTAAGLSADGFRYAWTTFESGNWIPLTWLSFQLDATLFGVYPAAFHASNLALHGSNVLLLFVWLNRVTRSQWRSLVVAGIFGLHPLHVESVAWVAERKDVLSTFWLLVALSTYERYAHRPTARWYLATCVSFALGLLSKSMLVTLPLLLLLVDIWPLERWAWSEQFAAIEGRYPRRTARVLILEKVPLLALSSIAGVMTIVAASYSTAFTQAEGQSLFQRMGNAVNSYSWYIAKTFVPTELSVLYPMTDLALDRVAISALFVLGICIFVGINGLRRPHLLFGGLWFFISLLPVIGLLQVGSQAHADRYCYVPHIGLLTLIVWEGHYWLSRLPVGRSVAIALATIAAAGCARLTVSQVAVWRTTETLWKHALEIDSENWFAHASLGNLCLESGSLDEAWDHFKFVLKRHPEYRDSFEKLVAIYRKYAEKSSERSRFRNELGLFYVREKKMEIARVRFAQAVAIAPDYVSARNNLALALSQLGRDQEATSQLETVLSQEPSNVNAHVNLGVLLEKVGRLTAARSHFATALQYNAADHEARDRLRAVDRRLAAP